MNKIHFTINVDNMIDLITNSSSELYVIDNNMTIETLVEMVNTTLKDTGFSISEYDVEKRYIKDGDLYDQEYKIDQALELFPESEREKLKEQFFSKPLYYGISFDRDDFTYEARQALESIGFECVDTDY